MPCEAPPHITSVLCSQERWEEMDGTGLPLPKWSHGQKQLPVAIDHATSR